MSQTNTLSAEPAWRRLDKRMLLVHPITATIRFIPVLVGSVILGTSSGNPLWSIIPVVLIVGLAVAQWFTTTYRIGATHIELRTGVLSRKKLSVPRSRIRSVDVEADLLHRALGLAVLSIGTGQHADSGEQFELDALAAADVPRLRAELLAQAADTANSPPVRAGPWHNTTDGAGPHMRKARDIGHWKPAWVRYAPLSLTGFAIIAPIVGLAFQYGLGETLFRSNAIADVEGRGVLVLALVTAALLLVVVLVVSAAACAHYVTTYFGLRVDHDGTTLHVRHGLFTVRQVSLDLARLRGATVKEPLLLRLAGGAELEAIMTGENPRQKLLPQAPRSAVEHTLSHLLTPDDRSEHDDPIRFGAAPDNPASTGSRAYTAPDRAPLQAHGPAARRRRYTRALLPVAGITVVLAGISLAGPGGSWWWWLMPGCALPLALALAEDRYRGLGHAVLPSTATSPTWLITRSGSLDRDRDCLEAPGVLGWTVRQTFFQRRAGLATVVAATAAGKKRYAVIDIAVDDAWRLIEAVTPGRLGMRTTAARIDDAAQQGAPTCGLGGG
ncbi:PH domain-containing protein [Nocardia sp. CNY236]|uniref:PH domain-containing protein n=1 Tax=Nocardia sp. CNY236 TaxID=1169152 RepID=UPI00040EC36F|nr:PH domain-containing protein [Nocardia sp. CNY236]